MPPALRICVKINYNTLINSLIKNSPYNYNSKKKSFNKCMTTTVANTIIYQSIDINSI
jgi:hypothetical protein